MGPSCEANQWRERGADPTMPLAEPTLRMSDCGESALVVEFGSSIDPAINARVHGLARRLNQAAHAGVLETVPTYRSLMVLFDPLILHRDVLKQIIASSCAAPDESHASAAGILTLIPVAYGANFGPDLAFVAQHNGLSEEQVIALHTSTPCLVYMLGFTPGFPYLGGMNPRLATPRLESPRQSIPAGSVGIAGAQTGIYPVTSPGGWRLIGRTPLTLFHPQTQQPFLFSAGEYLQFTQISAAEFEQIRADVAAGRYTPLRRPLSQGGDHVHGA